jgi:hypothetical protein
LVFGIAFCKVHSFPVLWDLLQQHSLIARRVLLDVLYYRNEHLQNLHVRAGLVHEVVADLFRLTRPVLGDVLEQ